MSKSSDDLQPAINLLNSPLGKQVGEYVKQRELAKRLTRDYRAGRRRLEKLIQGQFLLGREFVNIREQLGEAGFRQWMARMCPQILIEDALFFADRSLDSDLARQVEATTEDNS
jgi:hypothetical protein